MRRYEDDVVACEGKSKRTDSLSVLILMKISYLVTLIICVK